MFYSVFKGRYLLSAISRPSSSGDIFSTREQAGEGNRELLFLCADNLMETQHQADI